MKAALPRMDLTPTRPAMHDAALCQFLQVFCRVLSGFSYTLYGFIVIFGGVEGLRVFIGVAGAGALFYAVLEGAHCERTRIFGYLRIRQLSRFQRSLCVGSMTQLRVLYDPTDYDLPPEPPDPRSP